MERTPKTAPRSAVFCRHFTDTETYTVKYVNYVFQFSGPVTPLRARARAKARAGARAGARAKSKIDRLSSEAAQLPSPVTDQ
jgi:hypothetical protein